MLSPITREKRENATRCRHCHRRSTSVVGSTLDKRRGGKTRVVDLRQTDRKELPARVTISFIAPLGSLGLVQSMTAKSSDQDKKDSSPLSSSSPELFSPSISPVLSSPFSNLLRPWSALFYAFSVPAYFIYLDQKRLGKVRSDKKRGRESQGRSRWTLYSRRFPRGRVSGRRATI